MQNVKNSKIQNFWALAFMMALLWSGDRHNMKMEKITLWLYNYCRTETQADWVYTWVYIQDISLYICKYYKIGKKFWNPKYSWSKQFQIKDTQLE